ncbi:MAG: DsbA family protein [Planctomycetota bacterium]|jgi:protein-disulfide isomerase/uncharacterized membrane protein
MSKPRKSAGKPSRKSGAKKTPAPQAKEPATQPDARAVAPRTYLLGFVAIAVSIIASGMLVARHFFGMTLPGCGPESNCARAAASAWGSVPGVGWPVSIIGLAWFITALLLWVRAKGGASHGLKNLVRFGAIMSSMFITVMLIGGYVCSYCLVAHLANIAFWVCVERRPRLGTASLPTLIQGAVAMAVACGLLLGAEAMLLGKVQEKAEDDLEQSIRAILAHDPNDEVISLDPAYRFTGRYRQGPETAAIRIVIFSDYQCPDCKRIENQAREVLAGRSDVSFSAKHFPMCNACNPKMGRSNPHPNACWAARAAEAAGILHGEEGFWKMHEWLFDRKGSFTDAELRTGLETVFGWDVAAFTQTMMSQQTLDLVQADIAEAVSLGLHFTPMIFVNGVELKGYMAYQALIKMVDRVAAANPTPGTARDDRPPSAFGKYLDDWRQAPVRVLPGEDAAWTRGAAAADATSRILLIGDYGQSTTQQAHGRILELCEARDDVQYIFRHYPLDPACNPRFSGAARAGSALKARAAEAAGALGGADGFWAMHDWLMANPAVSTAEEIGAAAVQQGLDAAAFRTALDAPTTTSAITADCTAAGTLRFIPTVHVNNKAMPRWRMTDRDVLGPIVAENAGETVE